MKQLWIIVLASCLAFPLTAQRVKYSKDIFPVLADASTDEIISKLKFYLLSDLNHPHANFTLALQYEKRYRNSDVLTAYEEAIANAEQAKLRYLKAKVAVDEKEIRRNSNYYVQFASSFDSRGRPEIKHEVIAQKIQNGYDSALLLTQKLPPIYQAFTNSVYQYDQAIKLFSDINGTYKSLDELYLMYDGSLNKKLNRLKHHFDSTLFYLEKYQNLIQDYPINNYNQKYTLRPVITYRLDGLITQSNFLKNDIKLWNYGQWVDDIQSTINAAITTLRENVVKYEKALQNGLQKANSAEAFKPVKIDKELLFNLNKYDYQSLVAAVLQQKEFKQLLIHKERSKTYYDTATNINKASKYIYYSDLINLTKSGDSLITKIEDRLTDKKLLKHKSFFEKFYKGKSGFEYYINNEKNANTKAFRQYVRSLRNAIIDDMVADTLSNIDDVKYKNFTIPRFVTQSMPDSVGTDLITTHKLKNTDGSLYVAGTYRPEPSHTQLAYVAKLAPDHTVSWFKPFDIPFDSAGSDTKNFISTMVLTQEGCAVVVRSEHLSSSMKFNTFSYVTEAGEEKISSHLPVADYPRKINYNEALNSFLITLKGTAPEQNVTKEEPLVMLSINVIGDLLWTKEVKLAGTVEEVLNVNDGYLGIGNYTAIKDDNGKWHRLNKNTNAYALRLDQKGQLLKTLIIPSKKTYYISKIVKVNDANINLLGYEDEINAKSTTIDYADNLTHLIINADPTLISSSLY